MDEYFANAETDDLIRELDQRIDNYFSWVLNSGRLAKWRLAYNTYHGQRGSHSSSWVTSGGTQGELSYLMSNEYRNLVQHLIITATQQRPATQCIAANSDVKSQAQTILGDALLETYFKEMKVEKVMKQCLEGAIACFDVCWTFPFWDPTKGDIAMVNPETNSPVYEGDIRAFYKTPLEVIIDFSSKDPDRNDWLIIKDQVNKFDLAATFPDKAEEIINLSKDKTQDALFDFGDFDYQGDYLSDEIDVYTFMHEKTPAVPDGRMCTFFKNSNGLFTFDGPLPYKEIPAVRVAPTEQIMSKFGYSNTTDLLCLQDVMDALISSTVTNITSAGVNNIWAQKGDTIDYDQLAKGMSLLQSETKPETLILNQLNPQVLEMINLITNKMQTLSGVNAVARGDIQRDMSGSAMALVQSMAVQFNSGIQAAQTHQIEEVGTLIIRHLQNFAQTERLAIIAGKSRSYMSRYFSGKDLEKVDRVMVQQGNAYADTTAGRVDMADKFMQAGMVKNPDDYLQVLQTGRLEPVLEAPENRSMSIRAENESLSQFGLVRVVFTDDHQKHIMAHASLLDNPQSREDPNLIQAVKAHIEEHMFYWKTTPPEVLMALGIQPMPPTPMLPMPDANPGGAAIQLPGQPPAKPQPPMNAGAGLQQPGAAPQMQQTNMPQMPKNPMTGERAPSPEGLNQAI